MQKEKTIIECGIEYSKDYLQSLGELEFVKTDLTLTGTDIPLDTPVHVYSMIINDTKVLFETTDHKSFQCFQSVKKLR